MERQFAIIPVALVVISGLFIVACATQNVRDETKSRRNLSKYEKAGPYRELVLDPDNPHKDAEIRAFIWRHWHIRRLGYVHAIYHSPEGGTTVTDYYIEPDVEGGWQVTVQWQSNVVGSGLLRKKATLNKGSYRGYTLQRIRQRGTKGAGHAIPSSTKVPAESYSLILKDRKGKTVGEL
jgi:hypothetical protein